MPVTINGTPNMNIKPLMLRIERTRSFRAISMIFCIALISQGSPGQVQEHRLQVGALYLDRGNASAVPGSRLKQAWQDLVAVVRQDSDNFLIGGGFLDSRHFLQL